MEENYIEFKSDTLLIIRELATKTYRYFERMSGKEGQLQDKLEIKDKTIRFHGVLNSFRKETLKMMSQPDRKDAGLVLHLITYTQRLKDKITIYRKLITPSKERKTVKRDNQPREEMNTKPNKSI